MGTFIHDVTVIQADWESQDEIARRVNAMRAALESRWAELIVGPVRSVRNGFVWWAMLPDGSKEGWDGSIEGEKIRRNFAGLVADGYAAGFRFGETEPFAWDGEYVLAEDKGR